jgi:hypothetical protein
MAILARKKETLTRADLLRQRRGKTAVPVRMPVARAPAAGGIPASSLWEPRVRRVAPRAHRRIRLEEPGVEVQIPTVSVSVSARGLAMTLAVAAGGILLFLLTSAMFLAGAPAIEGTAVIAPDAVLAAADVEGVNLFLLDPDEIAGNITERIPGVQQAAVTIGISGAVDIRITERAPILLWTQDGQEYWVDADGVMFPVTRSIGGLVSVEVLGQGPAIALDGGPDVDPGVVINALELAVSLPQGSRILFDTQHGLGMADSSGMTVYFGTSGRIEQKMEIFRRLAQRFVARGIRPSLVDVQDIWQPFYLR